MAETSKNTWVKGALGTAALVAALPLFGLFTVLIGDAPDEMFITSGFAIRPYDQVGLYMLLWLANGLLIAGGLVIAVGLIWLSLARGFFGLLVGVVMGGMSLIALGLLLLAPRGEFDLGQRVVFGVIALIFGGIGGWYAVSDLRKRLGGGGS